MEARSRVNQVSERLLVNSLKKQKASLQCPCTLPGENAVLLSEG